MSKIFFCLNDKATVTHEGTNKFQTKNKVFLEKMVIINWTWNFVTVKSKPGKWKDRCWKLFFQLSHQLWKFLKHFSFPKPNIWSSNNSVKYLTEFPTYLWGSNSTKCFQWWWKWNLMFCFCNFVLDPLVLNLLVLNPMLLKELITHWYLAKW